jgi:putative membrane protein
MVKDHTKDISDFRKASKMTGPAGELAKATIPTLEKHLAMAKRLES